MAEYGYARVSDVSQHEDRQLIALHEQGIADKDIFLDKQSGKNFDRPRYKTLLRKLKSGDVVFFCSLDRMGRNYDEMRAQWNVITKEKGADIVVMDMAVLDTRVKGQDLTGRVICDVVLTLLSYCAQNERENIRKRQAEGIAAAKIKGVQFGRPPAVLPENFGALVRQWERGNATFAQTLVACDVSRTTFYKYLAQWRLVQGAKR